MREIINRSLLFMVLCISFCLWMPIRADAAARTGGIRIGVKSYEEADSGKRNIFVRKPELVPNEEISYIISVENQGSDAWVRLKTSYIIENESQSEYMNIDDSWLTGIGEKWIKKGEYWYYTEPLLCGRTVDFCSGLQVPDIGELSEGMKFRIISKAEAVQAANINIDFQSEEPFLGIFIEGNAVDSDIEESVSGFEVRYEDGAESIIDADELFADIEELMPGDIESGTVSVRNANNFDVRVILKETGEQVDDLVLKALQLVVYRGGTKIYEGPLANRVLQNGVTLGEFRAKSEEILEFQVWLPAEEKNESAFQAIRAALVFGVERVKKDREDYNCDIEKKEDISAAVIYKYPDPSVTQGYQEGSWKLIDTEKHKWEYHFSDGSKARNGWLYLFNPYSQDTDKNNWFYFDDQGIMQYGWIKTENENWYFCHEISDGNLGKLKKGWHHDQEDGRDYYLDPVTGIMQTGWRQIAGSYYYFTPLEETMRQNWFWNTEFGRWIYDMLGYRTYGSMFKAERTPDGYRVDEDGAWDGKERVERR